jgi:8-oxo-dGTP pyrophosphatase MutT (NUDIX family)
MTQPRRSRRAGRVLVVDETARTVLLLRGGDPARPSDGTWWFTPGGGTEPGESTAAAARRELEEETGHRSDDLGPVVWRRRTVFDFDGVTYEQDEDFYLLRTSAYELSSQGWSPLEVATIVEHRWWPIAELRNAEQPVYPEELADLLARLLD